VRFPDTVLQAFMTFRNIHERIPPIPDWQDVRVHLKCSFTLVISGTQLLHSFAQCSPKPKNGLPR